MKTIVNKMILWVILSSFALTSCSQAIVDEAYKADITLYSTEGKKTLAVSTKEPDEVARLSRFVSGKKAPMFKCGYSGKITFYQKGDFVEGEYSHSCGHIVFELDGELVSRYLTKEGVAYLKKLAEKKPTSSNNTANNELITFKYYGELGPNDNTINLKAAKYGFTTQRVAGCVIDSKMVAEIKAHNEKALVAMNKKYGKDWMTKFKKETSISARYYVVN